MPACQQFLAAGKAPERLRQASNFRCGHCARTDAAEPVLLARAGPVHDEIMILSGWNGAGEIVLGGGGGPACLADWRRGDAPVPVNAQELSSTMLSLQARGCHNIMLRSPGRIAPLLVESLLLAAGEGLRLPVVYQCSGQECQEALGLLDGLVDIFLFDAQGDVLAGWPGHERRCCIGYRVVREMHRQVGDLVFDADGLALSGMLVRHAVLPQGQACTRRVLEFLAQEVSVRTYLLLARSQAGDEQEKLAYKAALHVAKRLNLLRSDALWHRTGQVRPSSRAGGFPVRSE